MGILALLMEVLTGLINNSLFSGSVGTGSVSRTIVRLSVDILAIGLVLPLGTIFTAGATTGGVIDFLILVGARGVDFLISVCFCSLGSGAAGFLKDFLILPLEVLLLTDSPETILALLKFKVCNCKLKAFNL